MWENPWYFIAFGFGVGAIPFAPGTFGTLIAIPFYAILANLPIYLYGLIVLLGFIFGCVVCGKGAEQLGVADPSGLVWDEIIGYWLTMIAVPMTGWTIILGFVLFRFFDILKPWPISWCDKHIKGGFGIMFDDIIAAIMSWCVLQIIVWALHLA